MASDSSESNKNDRDARLAAALRVNLQRRKVQARGRDEENNGDNVASKSASVAELERPPENEHP
ncbi:transposase [Azospirillaceae bacterium]